MSDRRRRSDGGGDAAASRSRDDRAHWTAKYGDGIRVSPPSAWVERHTRDLAPNAVCVDLACGPGRHAALIAGADRTVLALDFVEQVVRVAAERPGVSGVVADAGALPLAERSLDLIVCVNFLDRSLLRRAGLLLRPGGRLVAETFTLENLSRVPDARRRGPSNPAYLLAPGELQTLVAPLRVVDAFEGLVRDAAGERYAAGIVAVNDRLVSLHG